MRTRSEMQQNLLALLQMPDSFTSHELAAKTGWIRESARIMLTRYTKAGLVDMVQVKCTHKIYRNQTSKKIERYYTVTDKGREVIAKKAASMKVAKGVEPKARPAKRLVANSVFEWGQV